MDQLIQQNPKGSLFSNRAVTLHLQELGYPQKSIESMEKCGVSTGFRVLAACGCSTRVLSLKHHCNLRTCPECAKKRKRRIVRQYKPFLESLPQDRTNFLYFLTISPQNYTNLQEGLTHIKKSFAKFLRHKYIKDRIKAGLYVIETKGTEGNWNIHIHAIVYGRFLDNRIRGTCLDCGQNLMKYDFTSKKFYCANRRCNSLNVVVKQNSRLVDLFMESSGLACNVHITKMPTTAFSLNYMCKYISANKDDFSTDRDIAQYIMATRKLRLISTFGLFYNVEVAVQPFVCPHCGCEVHFSACQELILEIELNAREKQFAPRDLFYYFPSVEV